MGTVLHLLAADHQVITARAIDHDAAAEAHARLQQALALKTFEQQFGHIGKPVATAANYARCTVCGHALGHTLAQTCRDITEPGPVRTVDLMSCEARARALRLTQSSTATAEERRAVAMSYEIGLLRSALIRELAGQEPQRDPHLDYADLFSADLGPVTVGYVFTPGVEVDEDDDCEVQEVWVRGRDVGAALTQGATDELAALALIHAAAGLKRAQGAENTL